MQVFHNFADLCNNTRIILTVFSCVLLPIFLHIYGQLDVYVLDKNYKYIHYILQGLLLLFCTLLMNTCLWTLFFYLLLDRIGSHYLKINLAVILYSFTTQISHTDVGSNNYIRMLSVTYWYQFVTQRAYRHLLVFFICIRAVVRRVMIVFITETKVIKTIEQNICLWR